MSRGFSCGSSLFSKGDGGMALIRVTDLSFAYPGSYDNIF